MRGIYVFIILLLTPWFWSFQMPTDLFNLNIKQDIVQAREIATWKRGKSDSKLNKIFVNWPIEILNRRIGIVMENFDIGNYFFKGHPRERVGVEEKQKFSLIQLPFLLIGFFSSEIKKYKKLLIYLFLFLMIFTFIFEWRSFSNTILWSIPFIFIMSIGLKNTYLWIRKK